MNAHIKSQMSAQKVSDYRTSLQTRHYIEKYFITFPQWDCSNDDIRQSILSYFPPHKFGISCIETHKDGGKHIHCIIALETKRTPAQFRQWVLSQFDDQDANKIHIGSVRAIKQAIEYMNKEDKDVYTVGAVPKYNSAKKGLTKQQIEMKIMAEQMEARKALDERIEERKHQREVHFSLWLRDRYFDWLKSEAQCNYYDLVEQGKFDPDVNLLKQCIQQWLEEYYYYDTNDTHFQKYLKKYHCDVKYSELKW